MDTEDRIIPSLRDCLIRVVNASPADLSKQLTLDELCLAVQRLQDAVDSMSQRLDKADFMPGSSVELIVDHQHDQAAACAGVLKRFITVVSVSHAPRENQLQEATVTGEFKLLHQFGKVFVPSCDLSRLMVDISSRKTTSAVEKVFECKMLSHDKWELLWKLALVISDGESITLRVLGETSFVQNDLLSQLHRAACPIKYSENTFLTALGTILMNIISKYIKEDIVPLGFEGAMIALIDQTRRHHHSNNPEPEPAPSRPRRAASAMDEDIMASASPTRRSRYT